MISSSGETRKESGAGPQGRIQWLDHVRFRTKDAPCVFTVAPKAGPVRTFEGLTLTPHHTFPGDQDRFAKMFPGVKLQRGVIFVHDGKAITGVGGARRYDPAMYLVERLYGEDARARIAEGLVLDWSRPAVKHRVTPGARLP